MAAGDFTIKVRFRSFLPGAGYTNTGIAKQGKTLVVGDCDFDYVSLGLAVNAVDFGLETIDAILFGQVQANGDTAPLEATPFSATYTAVSGSNGLVLVSTNASTQAEATDDADGSFTFFAFGDSASAPELT